MINRIEQMGRKIIIKFRDEWTLTNYDPKTGAPLGQVVVPAGEHEFITEYHPYFPNTMILVWEDGLNLGAYAYLSETLVIHLSETNGLEVTWPENMEPAYGDVIWPKPEEEGRPAA